MNPSSRDDGSSTQSFQSTTGNYKPTTILAYSLFLLLLPLNCYHQESEMDSDVLLKTWVEYGPGPVNLSDLFPGTPNFFHTLQKPDSPSNTASTLLLSPQHDSPCTNNTDEVNNGNTGDFSNVMGELATLMLGCSLLLNNADNDTEAWSPTQPSSSNLSRPTTTTTNTSTTALNISRSALSSFDFDFSPNNASSPTNDSTSSSRGIAVTKSNPSPTGFQFPVTANPRQDPNPNEDQQQQPHNGAILSPCKDITAEAHPSSPPTYQRKILPLPKRRLKGIQMHHEPIVASAPPPPVPVSTQFTFRSPTVPLQKPTEGGSGKVYTAPIIHNATPCDYTKKPKRSETYYTDQMDSSLQRKQNSPSITTSNAQPLVRLPSPSSSSSTLPNSSSPNQQHTPSPSTSSTKVDLSLQQPPPEKKKKKKKKKKATTKGKLVPCTSSSSTTTTTTTASSNYRQTDTKSSRPRRRRKNTLLDALQSDGQTYSGPLDIINTSSTDDWICLFCQYQIFKGGWSKRKKEGNSSVNK